MNTDKEDRTPDYITRGDAEVQLTVWPHLERRRVLWVILPKEAARAIEGELLSFAKAHGKIKLHGEEVVPPETKQN